ncbi:MAG: VOC family protein [Myxococcota bacterium]
MNRIHVSLRTADLEATTAFYTKMFGVGPDKVRDGYVRFAPEAFPIVLSLQPGEVDVDHFGLRVEAEQTDITFGALAAAGLPVNPATDVVCCHAKKDETWLRDPDGRAWEVYAVTDEAPEAEPSRACCA